MTMNRHDFLAQMHEIIQPKVYLEIGVQGGISLNLAKAAEVAIGIDPAPWIGATGNQAIFKMTSDDYFLPSFEPFRIKRNIDFAFIDGDHVYEQAVADFFHIQQFSHKNTIVAFDDVLPYSQGVGHRSILENDWAGDIWRAEEVLTRVQPNLTVTPVDVMPTGVLLVWDLDPGFQGWADADRQLLDRTQQPVPDHVINRTYAVSADFALGLLSERMK